MATNSYHIFMFPVSLKSGWTQADIDKMLNRTGWDRDEFLYEKGNFASNFSEQGYFYDFCSGALFDDPTSLNRVLTTYRYPIGQNAEYKININKGGDKRTYILKVDKIELNVYDEKAALLIFHLNNDRYTDVQDILYINDYGRRIYPQYLKDNPDGSIDLQATKNSFLADSICLSLGNRPPIVDDFSSYARKTVPPFTMPLYIKSLLPEEMHELRWLLDDRMFVVSYFSSPDFAQKMENDYGKDGKWLDRQRVEWDWYQYVFVDNDDPTCQDDDMFKRTLSGATYSRWKKYGTFFGVSRYSFVCLIGKDVINLLRHTKTMYYRMASLVLAQRALSLYYSREISEISKELDENKMTNKQLHKRVDALNRDYLRFVNNVYFREITPLDQGIDLYDMMQRQMNIHRDEDGLSREVEQLFHYMAMSSDERRNQAAENFNIIAACFLLPTLITGIWGMNLGSDDFSPWYVIWTALAAVAFVITYLRLKNKKK